MVLMDHGNWRLGGVADDSRHNLLHCRVLSLDQHSTEVSTAEQHNRKNQSTINQSFLY